MTYPTFDLAPHQARPELQNATKNIFDNTDDDFISDLLTNLAYMVSLDLAEVWQLGRSDSSLDEASLLNRILTFATDTIYGQTDSVYFDTFEVFLDQFDTTTVQDCFALINYFSCENLAKATILDYLTDTES